MKMSTKRKCFTVTSILMMVVAAVMHLVFGGTYLSYGKFQVSKTGREASYTNSLPVTSFVFITAIFMLIYAVVAPFNIISKRQYRPLAVFSWFMCLCVSVMNFAEGVLTGNLYFVFNSIIEYYSISSSLLTSQFTTMYNCTLADAIVTLGLSFPCSVFLMRLQNYKRAKIGDESQPTKEIVIQKMQFPIQRRMNEGFFAQYSQSSD